MHLWSQRSSGLAIVASALVACGGGDEEDPTCLEAGNCELILEAGDGQSAAAGSALATTLEVLVVDGVLNPAPGIPVTWSVVEGGGQLSPESPASGADGIVRASATLGTVATAPQVFEATVEGIDAVVRFTATARPGPAAQIQVVSGEGQAGSAGEELPEPFVVEVVDTYGNGVSEYSVTWTTSANAPGGVSPEQVFTDAAGQAMAVGTLGGQLVNNIFTARAEGLPNGSDQVRFMVTPTAGPASVMVVSSGDEQGGLPNTQLAEALVVRVTDDFGNPVEGFDVEFTVAEGAGASVSPATARTDVEGLARVAAVLGDEPGIYRFEASAEGLANSPLSFEAEAFPPVCTADGWCWDNPTPQGNHLYGAYTAPSGAVFAVGRRGTVIRYNGVAWEPEDSGTQRVLRAAHGVAEDFVVAVGDQGTVTIRGATGWTSQPQPTAFDLEGVWMASRTDGWAVGDQGALLRWDGNAFVTQTSPSTEDLVGVWGFSSNDVWAVGDRGTILRFDGTTWSTIESVNDADLIGVWGLAPNEVWIGGKDATILRWNGTEIESYPGNEGDWYFGFWGPRSDLVFVYGLNSKVRYWDGRAWRNISSTQLPISGVRLLSAMTSFGDERGLIVGEWGIMVDVNEFGGTASPRSATIRSVFGLGPDSAWAATTRIGNVENLNLLRYDGTGWTETSAGISDDLNAIDGVAEDEIWAVGELGSVVRYDGSTWTPVANPPTTGALLGVYVRTSTDVWVVGEEGSAARYDGSSWTNATVPAGGNLRGVYVPAQDEAWVAGGAGEVWRYDGSQWTAVDIGTTAALQGITGRSKNEIWTWGTGGVIYRYDGADWTRMTAPEVTRIVDLYPLDNGQAYAVGAEGVLMSLTEQGNWRRENSGTLNELNAVWGTPEGDVWALGEEGTRLRKQTAP